MADGESPAPSVDESVRLLLETGAETAALELVMASFSNDVKRFFAQTLRSPDEAAEAYSRFTESVFRYLPRFEFRSTIRTWVYVVARSASRRVRRDRLRLQVHLTPLSHHPSALEIPERPPSGLDARASLVELRMSLPPADRELLVLRIDRGLSFAEITEIVTGGHASPEVKSREESRLRKRFSLVRGRLIERGRALGLAPGLAPGRR